VKRSTSVLLAVGIVASSTFAFHVTSASGNAKDTACWDQYNLRGTQLVKTLVPAGVDRGDCTPAVGCWYGYRASDGRRTSWYVPHGMKPSTAACSASSGGRATTATPAVPSSTAAPAVVTPTSPASIPAPATTPPTTATPITTPPPATTTAATTTAAPAPTATPATTAAPAVTLPPTPVPTTAPPTTAPPPSAAAGGGFVETFAGNGGLDRFDRGVYHRDEFIRATTSWQADHDLNCGDPTTSRTIRRNTDEWIFTCRDHMMTSIGDTSGYSTGWFAPRQTFSSETVVSWDVNVTDLKARQWWEVSIVPATFRSGVASCPQCTVMAWLSPDPSGLPAYPKGSVVVGKGPFGNDIKVSTNGVDRNVAPYMSVCNLDPEGCRSKAIRRTFSITDNRNGTITVDYGGFARYTVPGSFPAGGFSVVFKDHNYTPNKDGIPVGHTWHWDNIVVR
jgi:hypothetical protein